MASINFFVQDIDFKLPLPRKTSQWIKRVIKKDRFSVSELNYIFCSDEYLRQINIQFLNHDSYTDIITFDNSTEKGEIEGEIYISIERVKENAAKYRNSFNEELHRVMIHGVLHLMGYKDKGIKAKYEMREKEDVSLSLR
jgi:rRNA maturation RNase YbeY